MDLDYSPPYITFYKFHIDNVVIASIIISDSDADSEDPDWGGLM